MSKYSAVGETGGVVVVELNPKFCKKIKFWVEEILSSFTNVCRIFSNIVFVEELIPVIIELLHNEFGILFKIFVRSSLLIEVFNLTLFSKFSIAVLFSIYWFSLVFLKQTLDDVKREQSEEEEL